MRDGLLQRALDIYTITEHLIKDEGLPEVKGKSWQGPCDSVGKKASWSVWRDKAGREKATDHREGKTYDVIALLALVKGITNREACRIVIERAGVKPLDPHDGKRSKAPHVQKSPAPSREESPKHPPFDFSVLQPRELDADEVEAIATTRGVSVRTVESLMKWGVIHTVTLGPGLKLPIPRQSLPMAAWALHTPGWNSFRLRAFCGQFPGFDGRFHKSLTPTGGSCNLPLWIGPENAERVLIVEGEGDALGAVEIARRERKPQGLAVVVIFSASIALPTSFLPRLQGRRVRITPHCSDSKNQGTIAAVKWAACCRPWAAAVEIFDLSGLTLPDGSNVSDLGDLAHCTDDVLNGLKGVTTW